MDYHPKEVVLTAMWLACKVEHFPHRYVLHYSSSCSGSSRVSIAPRYLNQEKVSIEPNKREFKYDSRAFADFGKVQTIHTIPFPEFHRRVASSPVVLPGNDPHSSALRWWRWRRWRRGSFLAVDILDGGA
jgi:hypothetical protein